MAKIIAFTFFIVIGSPVFAQLFAGGAYGTFNVPGASSKFRGNAPSFYVAYTGDDDSQQLFFDVSLYKKNQSGFSTGIYNDQGQFIGSAETVYKYSITHLQLGFKKCLAGDFSDSKFNFFLSGGIAVSFNKFTTTYQLAGYNIPDDQLKRTMFGFHFNTGGQVRLKPIIIELRGNFDLLLKPVTVEYDAKSNILSSTRIGVLFPLTKD